MVWHPLRRPSPRRTQPAQRRQDLHPGSPDPATRTISRQPGQPPIVWAVMWPSCGRSRVVNPLAAGDGGTSRDTGPAELISRQHPAGNLTEP